MATPTPKRPTKIIEAALPEVVDPRWILKALAATVAAAVALAYLSLCLLIYLGGWQAFLTPVAKVDRTPASIGLTFNPIRFDAAATGTPRLAGWSIPSDSAAAPTILFLHSGNGSLADTLPTLDLLHRAGLSVFAFDYRGFGESDGPHPTEASMTEDAAAALDFLLSTRHLPAGQVIPYGEGLGAVLATNLINAHPELPALILEDPDPGVYARATENSKGHLIPMRWLIRERFDLATPLAHASRPKLLFVDTPFGFATDRANVNEVLFRNAPDPKMTVTFRSVHGQTAYIDFVRRFLDQYVAAQAPVMLPNGVKP